MAPDFYQALLFNRLRVSSNIIGVKEGSEWLA
jgi:hypothetical protein